MRDAAGMGGSLHSADVWTCRGLVVREATDGDAEAVAAIGAVGFPKAHAGILPPAVIAAVVEQTYDVKAVSRSIASCAADERGLFLVAERDGELVGYLQYDEAGPEPELHRIYVAPDAVAGGIGSCLVAALEQRLDAGTSYVLMVAADNTPAVGFYRRRGFTVADTVDGVAYYHQHMGVRFPADTPPIPAFIMRRHVSDAGTGTMGGDAST